jgi:hypothetical protein
MCCSMISTGRPSSKDGPAEGLRKQPVPSEVRRIGMWRSRRPRTCISAQRLPHSIAQHVKLWLRSPCICACLPYLSRCSQRGRGIGRAPSRRKRAHAVDAQRQKTDTEPDDVLYTTFGGKRSLFSPAETMVLSASSCVLTLYILPSHPAAQLSSAHRLLRQAAAS